MLTALQLGNFKSWREVNAPLAPITGFFGTNSSGKTSLLQALLLMKQTTESVDQQQVLEFGSEKTLVDVGGFQEVIFKRDIKKKLLLGVIFDVLTDLGIDGFSFTSEISFIDKKVKLESFNYGLRIADLGFNRDAKGENFNYLATSDFQKSQKFYRFPEKKRLKISNLKIKNGLEPV